MAKAATTGVKLQWDNAGTPTDVAQLSRIGEFDLGTKEFVDCTAHDSPGTFREFIATILDTAEFDAEVQFDPADAGHDHLIQARRRSPTKPGTSSFLTPAQRSGRSLGRSAR
jgi:hypothetical protein